MKLRLEVADDDTQLIVAEMEEKNLFPLPVELVDLFDQVVDGSQNAQEGIRMVVESEHESDSVIPSWEDALDGLQTLQTYASGRGDEYVLGETLDLHNIGYHSEAHGPGEVSDQKSDDN